MKRMRCIGAAVLILSLCFARAPRAMAQVPVEAAQRLASPGFGVGARSMGMGNAFTGIADDFSALYWNPAGLAQAQYGEFSFGLSQYLTNDKSSYLGESSSYNNNATNLNTLGFVLPVPVRQGSLVLGFGFTRQTNFTSGVAFNGYNTLSSIIQTYAQNGLLIDTTSDWQDNLAYQLYLADTLHSPGGPRWKSPILNNVRQKGTSTEVGGLNNWMVGGAMDVARNLSVGMTLTYVSGSYRYDQEFHELDPLNVHPIPYDVNDVRIDQVIEDDISGIDARFGLLYREPGRFRVGFTIKTPTYFTIDETYSTTGQVLYRTPGITGQYAYGPVEAQGSTKYDVHTPWVFGAGASVTLRNFTLSGAGDYTDWTQTEFANADQTTMDGNRDFSSIFRGVLDLRGGVEYDTQKGVMLRGGFGYNPSIYKGDPSSFAQKTFTLGLGIQLGDFTTLDAGFAHSWFSTYRINYDAYTRIDETIATNTFLVTLTHHF